MVLVPTAGASPPTAGLPTFRVSAGVERLAANVITVKTVADIERLPIWEGLSTVAASALRTKLTKALSEGVALAMTVGACSISVPAKPRSSAPEGSEAQSNAAIARKASGRTEAPIAPDVLYVNAASDIAKLPVFSGLHADAAADLTAKITEALESGRALAMTISGQAIFVPSRINRVVPEATVSNSKSNAELVQQMMSHRGVTAA